MSSEPGFEDLLGHLFETFFQKANGGHSLTPASFALFHGHTLYTER